MRAIALSTLPEHPIKSQVLRNNMIPPIPFILELVIAAGEVEDAEEAKPIGLAWLPAGDVVPNVAELCFVGINVELIAIGTVGCP